MFVGRSKFLKRLATKYKSRSSELAVVYGRRRVGKSTLIEEFTQDKSEAYSFDGLEDGDTSVQIRHFVSLLKEQVRDDALEETKFQTWRAVFSYISQNLTNRKQKTILFFDELQWMAVGRSQLVSLIKHFWDNHWKKQNVMLILCGSIASFMVNKVLHSKALYGRVGLEILLSPMQPNEIAKMFGGKRSKEEILKYLLVFGGVPRYMEEINLSRSFSLNMGELCFSPQGFMVQEYEKIFYSQFNEAKNYQRISKLLQDKPLTLNEISNKLGVVSGGSLKQYLVNLENADVISSFTSIDMPHNTKFRKYRLSDEYLIFYYKFIEPNLRTIKKFDSPKLFEQLCESKWQSWLGFAFERLCLKNAYYIAEKLGFADQVIDVAPYFKRDDNQFQIDLLYKRSDKVYVICECKYYNTEITTQVAKELQRKCNLFPLARGYSIEKALISTYGADSSLQDLEFFDYSLTLEDLF